jgi:hypothetical protein
MTSGEERDQGRGFTIVDRRGDRDGDDPQQGEPEVRQASPRAEEGPPSPPPDAKLPKIDFATFVLSLGTSAMVHMGLVADPETGQPAGEKNLGFARQTIDTLEMLREKTRGNLEQDEARLIESLLYDLRMRFVEASR